MFAAKGLAATSIEAVAAAGVSRMTVYAQFGDKDALFADMIAVRAAALSQGLTQLASRELASVGAGPDALRIGLHAFGA